MTDVRVVHAGGEPPDRWTASLFLAGPTPRTLDIPSWRPAALDEIARRWNGPGTLVVFVPEPQDEVWPEYDNQITWELYWGDRCDVVLFWIPRGPGMLGLTTNDEWGRWKDSGRVTLGSPPAALSVRYQRHYAADHHIPVNDTLSATVASALEMLGSGAERTGGRRHVPLIVWRTPSFQNWLNAQDRAGNDLRGARLEWLLRIGNRLETVFFWALRVRVHVRAEDRIKEDEVVLSRPDISSVLAYRRAPDLAETEIVMIREFRAPSSSADGLVLELPGGSHLEPMDPVKIAAAEFAEETGLAVTPDRLVWHSSRQLAATVTAHRQVLFSVELTDSEIDTIRRTSAARGLSDHAEVTYPHVRRVRDLLADDRADWTTLGAIAEVLLGG